MIRHGRLNKRITIETYTQLADSYGETVKTWVTYSTKWASVEPLAMRELIAAKEQASKFEIMFRIKYISGVKPKMRVVYNGENYNIEAVINTLNRNKELQIFCSKVE